MELNKIYNGDCIEVMKGLPDNSVDAVITDPPYGLGFMGKEWDTFGEKKVGGFKILPRNKTCGLYEFTNKWAIECLRVLKPGGYLLSFAGTRTQHRIASAIEDAGFEIRDMIAWVYGTGFPKSLNIGKAIDKLQGNEREIVGEAEDNLAYRKNSDKHNLVARNKFVGDLTITKGNPDFEGWGTALKPSNEPLTLAQKPLTIVPQSVIFDITNFIGIILWELLSSANRVELISQLSQVEQEEEYDIALMLAEIYDILLSQEKSEKTDMSNSQEMDKIILNIVKLWNYILTENYQDGNKYTISTVTNLITELRILKYSLLPIMQNIITKDKYKVFGAILNVNNVKEYLAVGQTNYQKRITVQELVTNLREQNIAYNVNPSSIVAGHVVNTVLENVITNLGVKISPNLEPITLCRKPLSEKTVAENCLKWNVGGLNIDACRVEMNEKWTRQDYQGTVNYSSCKIDKEYFKESHDNGRFPANLIISDDPEVLELFPNTSKGWGKATNSENSKDNSMFKMGGVNANRYDMGGISASRFFYCAKASKKERNFGCEELEESIGGGISGTKDQTLLTGSGNIRNNITKNNHPTVKPIALMEYLIKLVSREGQTILDPFGGSGTTGIACVNLDRNFILIEKEKDYFEICQARINKALKLKEVI